jgi:transmembrane sensor
MSQLSDAKVAALWGGISSRRRARRARRHAAFALGGAAALLLCVFLRARPPVVAQAVASDEVAAIGPAKAPSALHIPALVSAETAKTVALDDGSRIELGQGARLDVRANTGTAFTVRLEGSATFDVTPGGPRRWSIVADLLTVDVIGTRFEVLEESQGGERQERVVVEHGIVVVRGDNVPGHFHRLVDGQSLTVSAKTLPEETSEPSRVSLAPSISKPAPRLLPSAAPRTPGWKELALNGDYAGAYLALDSGVLGASAHASVDDLLLLADTARLSRHGRDAVIPLSRVVEDHSGDPRASVAAFTLGRLELDTLGEPLRAALAFDRAISLGLPEGLGEDAYARLVEASARGGDASGARRAAAEYARKYPQGSRSSTMNRWLSGASPPPGAP